jgi:hypothetical protein
MENALEALGTNSRANAAAEMGKQYSLAKILGIWALAAIPMGILSWIVFPAVSPDFGSDPLGAAVTRIVLLTFGLIWLFVLSMIIVRQEEGDLRWATVKRRLRLNTLHDPTTGATRRRLWLWVIPFVVAIGVWDVALRSYVDGPWVKILPFLAEPSGYSFDAIFQYGLYHLHQPWGIPGSVIGSVFGYTFPSWRFRSTWMGVIVHSAQSAFFAFLVLGVVLGLA